MFHFPFTKFLILLFLFIGLTACAAHKKQNEASAFLTNNRAIAVISASTFQEVQLIRQSLLGDALFPKNTKIVPMNKLDGIDPILTKFAIQLKECQISTPIEITADSSTQKKYYILQRGGSPEHPCHGLQSEDAEKSQKWKDTVGQILIGILYVGGIALGIAAPFLIF